MNIVLLGILLVPVFGAGMEQETNAQKLWKSQMESVRKTIEKYDLPTDEPNQQVARQIGLPFFEIDFEDTPTDLLTVHSLRPQDVDVVAAMGDSITAANGAEGETASDIGIEYRSISYSIGGNATLEESITLPNILKKFNSRIVGYSYKNGPRVDQYPYGFNVAVPGHRAYHMLSQAERLIERLQTDNRSNYESDWKVNTLFIGGNDLCAIGRDPEGTTADVYVEEIKKSLDLLHQHVPRMIVNIVDILEIYLLPQVGHGAGSTPTCRALQNSFCGYVISTASNETEQEKLIAINKEYQVKLQALIDSGIYDTRDDFTVVIQPFLRDSVLPYTEDGEVDASYFAPDCFHFSDIGHAMGAINLWNNMLEPVGEKTTVWSITNLKVPTPEHPYIFTSKNSQRDAKTTVPPNQPSVKTTVPPKDPGPTEAPANTEVPVWVICMIVFFAVCAILETIILIAINRRKTKKDRPVH